MSYISDSLSIDEKELKIFELHWISHLSFAFWIILIIPTFGIAIIFALYEFYSRRTIEQGITSNRIIRKK
jgi:hypothetical protein